jgi:hypothetical protein
MIDVDLRTRPAAVRLVEPDDFRAFKIVARGPEAKLEPAVEAFGRMTDDGYVFVDIAALRQLAGERGRDGAWLESLDAMVEYARAHGWTDGTDAIRGHVQRND